MVVRRTGPRMTVQQQAALLSSNLNRELAIEVRGPKGVSCRVTDVIGNLSELLRTSGVEVLVHTPGDIKLDPARLVHMDAFQIDALAARVDALGLSEDADAPRIEPKLSELLGQIEWIDLPSGGRIMKGPASVELFNEVMGEYTPEGSRADLLAKILADPRQTLNIMFLVSLIEALDFANRLSVLTMQLGRQYRIPTAAEILQVVAHFPVTKGVFPINEGKSAFGSRDGEIFLRRTFSTTLVSEGSDRYLLVFQSNVNREDMNIEPDSRVAGLIRLVEERV